jgi:hypothetical protein
VHDVVDLVWEAFRLRRLKAHLFKAAAHEGMADIIGPLLDWNLTGEISRRWAVGNNEAVARCGARWRTSRRRTSR